MPINLPNEILSYIFMLNASGQKDYRTTNLEPLLPLITTRISSHVCHKWRQLILSSTKIWGRLLLFDNGQRNEWMEEVLRRSGKAPLWVYCSIRREDTRRMDASKFFFDTLAKNWERVEVMVYMANAHDVIESESTGRDWAFLHRPAPLLRIFSAWVYKTPCILACCPTLPGPIPVKKSLFSATSPLLHTFYSNFDLIDHHELHNFKNLRTLQIYRHSNLRQLLHILKMTPCLESLELQTLDNYSNDNQDLQLPVALPMLSTLNTDTSISTFLAILNSITTAPGCCIQSTVRYFDRAESSDSILEQIVEKIPKLLNMSIAHPEVPKISGLSLLVLDDNVISLSSRNHGPGPDFFLRFVWSLSRQQYERTLPQILRSFQTSRFNNNATDLYLELVPLQPISMRMKTALDAWLLSNMSVTCLHVRRMAILKTYIASNHFPCLHTIYIDVYNFEPPSNVDDSASHDLLDFLESRIDIGRPVSTICIEGPQMMTDDRIARLGIILNNLDGLKMVFKDTWTGKKVEYFCGSAGR